MKFHVVVILCVFAVVSILWTDGFNVETKHFTVYDKEQHSMFGFSVAEHQDSDDHGWVIVGAPEAQTAQPGVYRGGEVYRCNITNDNSCTPIYFDTSPNAYNSNPRSMRDIDNKTLQWFGATVSTSQIPGGPILACAPRYMWYSTNFARREPVGTCYITENSFSRPKEFSPCRTKFWGYHRQGSCQAGLSAALSKDGRRVLIGAPGSYYWQGQMYSIDSNAEFPYIPDQYQFFGESSGQTFSAPIGNLPRVLATKEGRAVDDDSYQGYSVATGNFEGNGEISSAVGMPRGDNLMGKVLLFSANMTLHHRNLTGTQMGAYFGYAIIACDVDGDGLDDLIVGAPMYTVDNPGETFETGRIHIFYQAGGAEKFNRTETRIGAKSRSRFGLSLASLNDIDRDGYGDFAVGAPYDGPKGRGAVYIYHGSKDGVLEKYSQVIYAEDVNSAISTFGFSVSGGLDLDGNQYPDMVVGAYESSTAAFFRSRPVIKMEAWVEFNSPSKSISLEDKNCIVNGRIAVSCLELNTCLKYTGIGVNRNYRFNVEYALDVKKPKNPRLFFVDHDKNSSISQNVILSLDDVICKTFKVYVSNNITDKLTSIDAEMRMNLVDNYGAATELRNPSFPLTPILGTTTSRQDTLSIFKRCGDDNVCVPNLQLTVTPNVKKYLLGSGEKLELDVIVHNVGEDAYEALYYLEKPPGIEYINIQRIDKTEIPVQCSGPGQKNNYTLLCDIGNPLPEDKFVHFKVILQPVQFEGLKANYDLHMAVNSTNPELNGTGNDNKVHLVMPIWIQTELFIEGSSKPKELYVNYDNYTSENITSEWEFGPLLTHDYTIRNDGPSEIMKGEASIIWPAQTLSGEELLYLIDMPDTAGLINCGTANANYLSLVLDEKSRYQLRYKGTNEGFSGATNSGDKINEIADAERRKQQQEQHNIESANGTRDYNVEMETEVIVSTGGSTGGSKNSSSKYFSNFTDNTGLTHYEFEQRERQRIENAERAERIRLEHEQEFEQRERSRIEIAEGAERLRHELEQAEMEKRKQLENERIEAERQRIESQRIEAEQKHPVIGFERSENERTEDISKQRLLQSQQYEAERLRQEQIRQRQEEIRRYGVEHRTNERTELPTTYGVHRQYITETGNERTELPATYGVHRQYITGSGNSPNQNSRYGQTSGTVVTEEHEHSSGNSGLNVQLSNIGSSKDLEKFFSTLNHDAPAIATYSRDGKEYGRFDGRFRVSDNTDYIQFRNGEVSQILDRFGAPSYTTGHSSNERFVSMEGQLVAGDDGKIYVQFEDGRRFVIPGTYTYRKTHTYTVGGGAPRESVSGTSYSYGKQFVQEGNSGDGRTYIPHGNNHREESYEQNYNSERKIISGTGGSSYEINRDTFSGDNVATSRPDDRVNRYPRESDVLNVEQFRKFERKQRREREVADVDFDENESDDGSSRVYRDRRDDEPANLGAAVVGNGEVSTCKSAKCVRLQCQFGPLKKGQEVFIRMRYRVKAKTLNQIALNDDVKVSTQVVARVTQQEFITGPPDEQIIKSHEITTTIHPSAGPVAPDIVPLWVVVLSACAGAIILLLLIFLLYKVGFFNRNRPNNTPERQPLNRNGHYSNDY